MLGNGTNLPKHNVQDTDCNAEFVPISDAFYTCDIGGPILWI